MANPAPTFEDMLDTPVPADTQREDIFYRFNFHDVRPNERIATLIKVSDFKTSAKGTNFFFVSFWLDEHPLDDSRKPMLETTTRIFGERVFFQGKASDADFKAKHQTYARFNELEDITVAFSTLKKDKSEYNAKGAWTDSMQVEHLDIKSCRPDLGLLVLNVQKIVQKEQEKTATTSTPTPQSKRTPQPVTMDDEDL